MTSDGPSRRRFLPEPLETTSRTSRRQHSDRSDATPSPSNDSDSTASTMAVMAGTAPLAEPTGHATVLDSKKNVQHVEGAQMTEVNMSDGPGNKPSATVKGMLGMNNIHTDGTSDNTTQQHKPRRKFAPEPVETSTRSSRKERDLHNETAPNPKRKLTPEPIETTVKSSRSTEEGKPRRKFNVEPIETSSSSSKEKGKKTDGLENGARPKRRFAVEPVETSARSSNEKGRVADRSRRKFAVEPVETTSSSSRQRQLQHDSSSNTDEMSVGHPSRTSTGSRKFSPELLGTAKASYRRKPEVQSAVPKWLRDEAEDEGSWSAPEIPESRYSAANLAKKARSDPRRHSYSVPDLPMIQSDSSEEELLEPPTPGVMSHYNSRDSNTSQVHRQAHHHIHQQHLEDLKTLREQAVAAYGQQEDHVPFGHYGGDSEDEDSTISVGKLSIEDNADPTLFRRMSHHDLHLVMEDMRRHHDQLEKAKRDLQEDTAGISRFSAAALAARHRLNIHHLAGSSYRSRHETYNDQYHEEDNEFAKIRKAASPPMQGNDIKFPFSVSPKMTRCDPDQAPRPRRANSEEEEEHDIGTEGMWSAHVSPVKKEAPAGLWGGLCQKDNCRPTQLATPMRSGLQTPAFEQGDPLESKTPGRGSKTPRRGPQPWSGSAWMPLTPPRSKQEKGHDSFTAALDKKLTLERQIDDEFPHRVITQIYNYLSLGYPPIARPFDEELSKISRIPVAELRKGDRSATGTMKGHVGVPEGEGDAEEDDDGRVKCRRWDALRLYVREWARQSPNFAEQGVMRNVGTGMWGNNAPVRKGSWGF